VDGFDYNKLTGEQKSKAEQIKRSAEKYKGKSRAELMSELEKMKMKGEVSPQRLEAFRKKVSPMLNAEQRKRLEEVIKKLT